jgi:hypothetical protein
LLLMYDGFAERGHTCSVSYLLRWLRQLVV